MGTRNRCRTGLSQVVSWEKQKEPKKVCRMAVSWEKQKEPKKVSRMAVSWEKQKDCVEGADRGGGIGGNAEQMSQLEFGGATGGLLWWRGNHTSDQGL